MGISLPNLGSPITYQDQIRVNERGEVIVTLGDNWKEELSQLNHDKRQEVYEWLYDLGHRIRR